MSHEGKGECSGNGADAIKWKKRREFAANVKETIVQARNYECCKNLVSVGSFAVPNVNKLLHHDHIEFSFQLC